MSRHKKRTVLLKTLEEQPKPLVVIRLGPEKIPDDTRPPVRLGPVKAVAEEPKPEDANTKGSRTHQPDIGDLIENNPNESEFSEHTWGKDSQTHKNRPWGWLTLAGLTLSGGIVWSLLSVKKADLVAEKIRVKTNEIIVDEAAEQEAAEKVIANIESAMRAYFSASSTETRLRWVRFPDRVGPMMRQHEAVHPVKPSPLREITLLQPLPIESQADFWLASLTLATGERRELIIEYTDAGSKIDWETMVCHQPMPWDEFATRRPTETSMDFRVHVLPDTFYTHEFGSETEWACYRLSALGAEEVLFGYARRGTDEEANLAELTSGIRHASLILRLHIPAGLQSPTGVVIEKIISPRWLHITLPEEDN